MGTNALGYDGINLSTGDSHDDPFQACEISDIEQSSNAWLWSVPMTVLREDIAAFETMKAELEAEHFHEWVVFHHGRYVASFSDFEAAAATAVERFDSGPYLIRQVGAPSAVQLPGGMIFTPSHARDTSRV